jgi:hypothetical protein
MRHFRPRFANSTVRVTVSFCVSLRGDCVPTGFKPHGAEESSIKGHVFGLDLPAQDRKALIAFLKTL